MVYRFLIAVVFCCEAQDPGPSDFRSCGSRALEHRLNSYGAWAYLLHTYVSPALTDGFLITEPPGKPMKTSLRKGPLS